MTANTLEKPSISILVPICNVEKYLPECLDSLSSQTINNLEFICINDGSTDNSLSVLRDYASYDARIVIIDKPNSGYGASMNKGLEAATGEYIGILESDDFIDLDAFEILYRTACENDAEVVKANFYFYWSVPKERIDFFRLIGKDIAGIYNPKERTEIYYSKPTIWSAIYNREFLNKNNIKFLETPGASYQDASFNFKVWASAERAVFLKEAYLYYRQDNEQSSVNSPGKVYCVCDEYAEMQRYLDARPETKERLQGVLIRMKFDTYMWNYDRIDDRFRLEFLEKASEEFNDDLDCGRLDIRFFEPWVEKALMLLMKSPNEYYQKRLRFTKPGKINTIKYYHSLGGISLVLHVMLDKLQKLRKR